MTARSPLPKEERAQLRELCEQQTCAVGPGRVLALLDERDALEEALAAERSAAPAYVADRAAQYANSSGSRAALEDVATALRDGEHLAALRAGELDDLVEHYRRHPRPAR